MTIFTYKQNDQQNNESIWNGTDVANTDISSTHMGSTHIDETDMHGTATNQIENIQNQQDCADGMVDLNIDLFTQQDSVSEDHTLSEMHATSEADSILDSVNEKDASHLGSQTFETMISQLKNIIEDFQKGNMKLSQAVEKYNSCLKLIEGCNQMLDQASSLLNDTHNNINENSVDENQLAKVDFEDNMLQLESMLQKVNNQQDITLEDLVYIGKESKIKIVECEKVLDNFQTLIEYAQ